VISHADGVDPVGACVGPRGSRVRMVVSELRGEKIDIIPHNDEPARFVAKALSPARVREVLVDDEDMRATVIVPDDQLSLAIGREGQNARLAAKLTGWRVDIKSETEFSEDDEIEIEEAEQEDGRCAAVLSAGRRCPNASLTGSRYCGLPQHQALARFETNKVTVLAPLTEGDIQTLADSDADEAAVKALVERAEAEHVEEEEASEESEEAEETPADEDGEPQAEESTEGEAAEPEAESEAEETPEETPEEVAEEAEELEKEAEEVDDEDLEVDEQDQAEVPEEASEEAEPAEDEAAEDEVSEEADEPEEAAGAEEEPAEEDSGDSEEEPAEAGA
jgi:N utilization substance protein A